MKKFKICLLLLGATNAQTGCSSTDVCPDMGDDFSCGKLLNTYPDPENTDRNYTKCGYMTTSTYKFGGVLNKCKNMQPTADGDKGTQTGMLVSVSNQVENDLMTWHMRNVTTIPGTSPSSFYHPWAYIGLRKSCQDCNWHWMDGRPFTYNKWHYNEPNYAYYECAWARVTLPDFGTWYAKSCSSAYPGYCEYYPNGKPPQFNTDISMPSAGGCKPGWWRYAGYCYKLMGFNSNVENKDGFRYALDANNTCFAGINADWPGSTLAIMPSIQHNELVTSLLSFPYGGENPWIGLYNFATYDYYFAHMNRQDLAYTNWAKNSPNHLEANIHRCVDMKWKRQQDYFSHMEPGVWENTKCDIARPFVCSHEYDPTYSAASYQYPADFTFPGLGVDCPAGWIPYHGSCYKMYVATQAFEAAQQTCVDDVKQMVPKAKKGHLVTILDDYEYGFVRSMFRDDAVPDRNPAMMPGGGLWLGLKINSRSNSDGDTYNSWGWVDGWPLEIVKWAPGAPANVDTTTKKCAKMAMNGTFVDTECNTPMSFVCKADFFDFTPGWDKFIGAVGKKYDCPQGWKTVGVHCAKYYSEELAFNQARQKCIDRGGDLASIHSSGQNKIYYQMYSDGLSDNRGMWIGLQALNQQFSKWTDGSSAAYFNWADGEPNDWSGPEDCVEMYRNGRWNDERCNNTLPYTCKILAPFENCLNAQMYPSGVQSCIPSSWDGAITEEECTRELACCWDPKSPINCYKPKIHLGTTIGAAVAGTIVGCICFALGGYLAYRYGLCGGFSTSAVGIANPNA